MTFDEVIEQHRISEGATKIHVTLGPDATPEGLMEEFRKLAAKHNEYYSFPEVLRLKALIARYDERLREIGQLGKIDFRKYVKEVQDGTVNDELTQIKMDINRLADFVPDVDLERDIEFCRKGRPYGNHPATRENIPL